MKNKNVKLFILLLHLIYCSAFNAIAQAQSSQANSSTKQKSAAMQRFELNDSENELYARFSYQPIKGLGYEKGVHRRDPSSIIKVGDLYYVWYTRS